jgi:hypothetical protein
MMRLVLEARNVRTTMLLRNKWRPVGTVPLHRSGEVVAAVDPGLEGEAPDALPETDSTHGIIKALGPGDDLDLHPHEVDG